jgi:hypothetical protein
MRDGHSIHCHCEWCEPPWEEAATAETGPVTLLAEVGRMIGERDRELARLEAMDDDERAAYEAAWRTR